MEELDELEACEMEAEMECMDVGCVEPSLAPAQC